MRAPGSVAGAGSGAQAASRSEAPSAPAWVRELARGEEEGRTMGGGNHIAEATATTRTDRIPASARPQRTRSRSNGPQPAAAMVPASRPVAASREPVRPTIT